MSSGGSRGLTQGKGRPLVTVAVSGVSRLAEHTYEIRLQRPDGFGFLPGQKIGVVHKGNYRDYSLTGSIRDRHLSLCVRRIPGGRLSPVLADARTGDTFQITPAFGFFLFQTSERIAVFVATGTGIAPFVAFVRAGASGYYLLHGVRSANELYYRQLLAPAAKCYRPCLTGDQKDLCRSQDFFGGRVTRFLEQQLPQGAYDFYLCGRGEMLRDAMGIIDRRFAGARVFSELFF